MNTGMATETVGEQLILAITGDAPRSRRARANLQRAIQSMGADLAPREIDLLEEPEQSLTYGILATPALVHVKDGSCDGVLYGDLSDEVRLTRFLKDLLDNG